MAEHAADLPQATEAAGPRRVLSLRARRRSAVRDAGEDSPTSSASSSAPATEFTRTEVIGNASASPTRLRGCCANLLAKAGELGLLGVDIAEEFRRARPRQDHLDAGRRVAGGRRIVGDHLRRARRHRHACRSPSSARRRRRRSTCRTSPPGEKIAAYALTEAGQRLDALGAKTVARLSADGKHYVVNGGKMWITNGGFADVYVVFLKVDGDEVHRLHRRARHAGLHHRAARSTSSGCAAAPPRR